MKALRAGRFQILSPQQQADKMVLSPMQSQQKHQYHYDRKGVGSSTGAQSNMDFQDKSEAVKINICQQQNQQTSQQKQGNRIQRQMTDQHNYYYSEKTPQNINQVQPKSKANFKKNGDIDISIEFPKAEDDFHNQNQQEQMYLFENGEDPVSPLQHQRNQNGPFIHKSHFSQINEESKEVSTYRVFTQKNTHMSKKQTTKSLATLTLDNEYNDQVNPTGYRQSDNNMMNFGQRPTLNQNEGEFILKDDSVNQRDSQSYSHSNSNFISDGNQSPQNFKSNKSTFNFMDVMKQAQDHFKEDGQQIETASSNIDESMMNAYREVVPKAQFEALKNENARIRRETPKMKENLDQVKQQTRNIENEVNFLMAGVENTEEIKQGYDKKVKSFDSDIEIVKRKIDQAVLQYTEEKIKTQNLDLAFKRIMNTLIRNCQENKDQIIDENLRQLLKELSLNEKQQKLKNPMPNQSPGTRKKTPALTPQTFTIGNSFLNDSQFSLKTAQGQLVNEAMIAKIDNLEKELIKKKYELQIVRKDLYNNLEKEQKDRLILDLQQFGETAVTELVKVFTVQDSKKQPKRLDEIKSLPTRDFKSRRTSQKI